LRPDQREHVGKMCSRDDVPCAKKRKCPHLNQAKVEALHIIADRLEQTTVHLHLTHLLSTGLHIQTNNNSSIARPKKSCGQKRYRYGTVPEQSQMGNLLLLKFSKTKGIMKPMLRSRYKLCGVNPQ
jgi:hypothetical protein